MNNNPNTNNGTNGNGAGHSMASITQTTDTQGSKLDTYIQPPPVGLVVPPPPADFQPGAKGNNRGSALKGAELAALPDAAKELANFSDYAAVLGKTAPPQAHVAPAVGAVAAWYLLLTDTEALLKYIRIQGGSAWHDARSLINGLRRPWQSACTMDPTLATQFPALTRLLSVKKVAAKKGAATRAKEKAARARGEVVPTRGRRKKAPAAPPATPPTQATPATPAVNGTPASNGAGTANGAPHA